MNARRALICGASLIAWVALQSTPMAAAAAPLYGAPAIGAMASHNPWTVTVADFNGDDHPDIIVCNGTSEFNEILLGNGDRTFEQPQIIESTSPFFHGAAGDLNEDGIVDFVSGGPRVYIGNGDGTFQPAVGYGTIYSDLAIADLDGDHHLDVLSGGILFAGLGDGTLDTARVLLAGYYGEVEVGYSNGDTLLDIVTWQAVLLNQGGGVFTPSDTVDWLPGDDLASVALRVADMDGDDVLDAVNQSYYYPGAGDGTFGAGVAFALTDEHNPLPVDLDHDGIMDVLTARSYSTTFPFPYSVYEAVRYRLGLGGGAFGPPVEFGSGRSLITCASADFDSDGWRDVVTASYSGAAVMVFHGNGDGTFGEGYEGYAAGGHPVGVAIGDAIGDAAPDVLVASSDAAALRVFLGLGNGALGAPVDLATPGGPSASLVLDLNLDTYPDVVACGTGFLSVFPGLGGGALGPREDHALPGVVRSVTAADLDGDTRPDLLVAGAALSVFITQPDGSLGPRADYAGSCHDVRVGELTGDDHPDVVTGQGGSGSSQIVVRPGSATGSLGAASYTNSTSTYYSLALDEVTGDSELDAILLSASTFGTYPGNGDGTWGAPIPMPAYTISRLRYSRSVVPRDVTGDGILDLVTANDYWHGFAVFPGLGGGQFDLGIIHVSGVFPTDVALGDLDGDGRDEVVVANYGSETVTVHRPLPLEPLAVRAHAGTTSGLAFTRVWPLPAHGALNVAFTLPTDAPATLEIVDLAGRRLHREEIPGGAPGPRTVRIAPATALAPGVYWVRLAQDGARARARAIVLD